ncbi:MCE family protein [Nocardia sp. NBC_00881]|uniref:MCE family protein n=1 Tax=Nocardia sp. NBC_00881 TaxID=2975995 RepID=UPI00386C0B8B|nr:MCE family protein [Nocardia sp. NBC_00881]
MRPGKHDAVSTAPVAARQGRVDQRGDLARADDYLRQINASLPVLQRDLSATGDVIRLYVDTAPDPLRTLDNAAVASGTTNEGAPYVPSTAVTPKTPQTAG